MGCRQVRVRAPPNAAKSASSAPTYVKSALKDSMSQRGGKTKKLSLVHGKKLATNKSVNFDERVRIKSRTPTPKTRRYERQSSISSEDGSSIEQASESSSSLSPSKSSRQKIAPRNAVSPAASTSHQYGQTSLAHPRLIEHRLPLANGGSSAQTTYYEFSRRQGDPLQPSYTKRTTN